MPLIAYLLFTLSTALVTSSLDAQNLSFQPASSITSQLKVAPARRDDFLESSGAGLLEPIPAVAKPCTPSGKFHFVCGPSHSEDMVLVPGTHWIIASGQSQLYLIDTDAKTWKELYPGGAPKQKQDMVNYGNCPGAPDPKKFSTLGLSIRSRSKDIATLYAINKGTRDGVEVFEVDAANTEPNITWIGCAVMPKGTNGNAVTSLPDGTILVTSIVDAGHTREEGFSGRVSGGVYEWHPKTGFHLIRGTELAADNGIESSLDGKEFYVNATGGRSVTKFRREGGELKREKIDLDFGPDNIRWGQNGLLFISGRADEPACGGTLAARNGKLDTDCLRGFEIVTLDPKTMKIQFIMRTKPDPVFNAWSTALQVGNEIWMPGVRSDRVGYMPLN